MKVARLGWRKIYPMFLVLWILGLSFSETTSAEVAGEYLVYNIHQALNLGYPNEFHPKDYYLTIGSDQGVHKGSILAVMRRIPSADLMNQQFYQEMTFPIGLVRVIHAEPRISIARLEKMFPIESTPTSFSPQSIMIGDLVTPTWEAPETLPAPPPVESLSKW